MIKYIFDKHVLIKNCGLYQIKKTGGLRETVTFQNFNDAIAKILVERLNQGPTDHFNNIINQTMEAILLRSEIKRLTQRKKKLLSV